MQIEHGLQTKKAALGNRWSVNGGATFCGTSRLRDLDLADVLVEGSEITLHHVQLLFNAIQSTVGVQPG
jgi:hypothetical protein